MSKEDEYDQIIAPLLLKVAQICNELGMPFVARVEWEPGEGGVTQSGDCNWSASQMLASNAVNADGNFDLLAADIIRKSGIGNSMALAIYQNKDYRDLVVFLASCVSQMADSRLKALASKNVKKAIVFNFPVVQGLEAQMQIDKIGSLSYDPEVAYKQGKDFLEIFTVYPQSKK